jgi:hypothetical protein
MRPYRGRLGDWFENITGGSGEGFVEGDNSRKGDLVYLVALVLVVVVSIALLIWVPGHVVQFVIAALWGLTVGGALLLYLPAKILITLIGGLLGITASDLSGLAQVVEKMAETVNRITTVFNSTGSVQFQQQAVWLFLVLVALCCVPAYRVQTNV